MKTENVQLELREELVNSITHGIGILFGLVFIPILIYNATNHATTDVIAGAAVYGLSFLMVFTFSTIFHWYKEGRRRTIFKILDHISIYFLIAGTYTPFILVFVNNSFGITLLLILWTLTLLGTVFKTFFTGKYEIVSTLIYVVMGWMLLFGGNAFFENMPSRIIYLIVSGGCLYSVGVIFYLWRCFAYHHAVWHIFVLGAAICHFTAIAGAMDVNLI